MNRSACIICEEGPPQHDVAIYRLNATGEDGLWACTTCRVLFGRGLRPTTEVIERAMALKAERAPVRRHN